MEQITREHIFYYVDFNYVVEIRALRESMVGSQKMACKFVIG